MILAVSININAAENEEKPLKGLKEYNNASLFASLERVEENLITLAPWMLDVEFFTETDEFMEIEDWMLDPSTFKNPGTPEKAFVMDEYFTEDYEEEVLEIEPWMLSVESFDLDYFEADYEEPMLPIEDWMFNF